MFTIEALTPTIGAEVRGIDLTQPLDAETQAALSTAWMEHLVLFFRDQVLDKAQLQALARCFGEPHIHPQGDVPGFPGLIEVHTDAESKVYAGHGWHADASCDGRPPTGSILHLHQVPGIGGDTLFASMYAAYEALSEPMKHLLEGLQARHSGARTYGGYFGSTLEEMRDQSYPEALHPVVVTHPVTGRKALYVNEIFTLVIEGLEAHESRALLDFLYRHLQQPRFQCRFRWRTNSVAMWDNRCTQHLALWDYHPETRSGYRATVVGQSFAHVRSGGARAA